MLISEKQRKANQANAKKSTGPKTPEGKDITRLNAMKNMLYTLETVVYAAGETDQMWLNHLQSLVDDLHPQDSVQYLLVHDIASCTFRLQRLKRMEAGHIDARASHTYNVTLTTDSDGYRINPLYDGYPTGVPQANSRLIGDTAAQVTTCTKLLPDIWHQEVRLRNAWQKNLKLLKELQAEAAHSPAPTYEQDPEPAPQPGPAAANEAQSIQNKGQRGPQLTLPAYPVPFTPVSDAWQPQPKPVASAQPATVTAKQSRN